MMKMVARETAAAVTRLSRLLSLLLLLFGAVTDVATATRIVVTADITENAPVDTVVTDLRRDGHLDTLYEAETLPKLTFAFLSQVEQRSYFSLDPRTGELRLAKSLDREALCPNADDCPIALTVAVQPVQHFMIIGVTIRVADVNDNEPAFGKAQETLALSESTALGFVFPLPQARDADSPAYGVVRYELHSDTRYFALNVRNASATAAGGRQKELELQLIESLDFEEESFIRLLVVAYDGGNPSKTGKLIVEINVLDENDNSPKFDNPVYEVTVIENRSYDTAIITVRATDKDFGRNGLVKYAFSSLTEDAFSAYFRINRDTGDIHVVRPIDYEKHSSFLLQVVARDQGDIAAVSMGKVLVHVTDVNDNRPVITVNPEIVDGVITIDEQLPTGTFIAHVSVTDADGLQGGRGALRCNFTADGGVVLQRMYDSEYKLVTSEVLDRENKSYVDVSIRCSDGGNPPLTSSVRLTVRLADVNDNAPYFTQAVYRFSVAENNSPHTNIGPVQANDPDNGVNGTVRYRLGGEGLYFYWLDPVSGVLTVNGVMDRERDAMDTFEVYAYDLAVPSTLRLTSTATVIVTITDSDDNAPTFAQQHVHFSIDEGLPVNSRVGQVNATDKDLPPNNVFYYVITSMNPLAQTDSSGSSSKTTSSSTSSASTSVLPFDVDRATGVIRTKRVLDRERQASYDFRVRALTNRTASGTGGGGEGGALSADSVHVTVTVYDVNDNTPVIDFPRAGGGDIVQLSYATPINHVVERASVHASDADSGKNAELTYSITAIRRILPAEGRNINSGSGNSASGAASSSLLMEVFVIESTTGLLVIKRDLSPFKDASYNITVKVADGGVPSLSAMASFIIIVNGSIPFDNSEDKTGQKYGGLLLGGLPVRLSGFHLYIVAAIVALFLIISIFALTVCCRHSRQRRTRAARKRQQQAEARQHEMEREKATAAGESDNGALRGGGCDGEMSPDKTMHLLHDGSVVALTKTDGSHGNHSNCSHGIGNGGNGNGSIPTLLQQVKDERHNDTLPSSCKLNGRYVTDRSLPSKHSSTLPNRNGKHAHGGGAVWERLGPVPGGEDLQGQGGCEAGVSPTRPADDAVALSPTQPLPASLPHLQTQSWRKVRFTEPQLPPPPSAPQAPAMSTNRGEGDAVRDVTMDAASSTSLQQQQRQTSIDSVSSSISRNHLHQYPQQRSEINGKIPGNGTVVSTTHNDSNSERDTAALPHYATVSKRNSNALPRTSSLVRAPSGDKGDGGQPLPPVKVTSMDHEPIRDGTRIYHLQTTTSV